MAGGTNHNCFLMLGTEGRDAGSRGVETEIDHHVCAINIAAQVVSLIDLTRDLEIWFPGSASSDGLAHLALRACNYQSDHRSTPHRFIVCRKISRFFAEIETSGKRNSS